MLNKKNKALQAGQLVALIAGLLIAGQIGYSSYQGTSFCPNDGCEIVEVLIKVSPLVFNIIGFFYFQIIYWGLRAARGEQRRLSPAVSLLLLAGLIVEAVLVSFQYLIAQTFCLYCVAIFGCIVVLNCLLGVRHILSGVLVFGAAALSFASLDFHQAIAGKQPFVDGVFASRSGLQKYPEHYLFYSSTCTHCEKVISFLKDNARMTIHFNPIDLVTTLNLPEVTFNTRYNQTLNKALLTSLGIDEIPVLMTRTPEGWMIRRGESAILAFLSLPASAETSGQSSSIPAVHPLVPGLPASDGCGITEDCSRVAPGYQQPTD
ncbi:MAG: vitamin K epoxide reductase family protein [Desulfobulbus oligotrophicus]|jgi:hypothetical protein|nr:vitamin K epoxide reductase family protein [Desulfobulbus oligotrophicus]